MDADPHIVIYGTRACCYCTAARALLDNKGLSYEDISISDDANTYREMIRRCGGNRQVPQIFINNTLIGGFDELYMLEKSGELDRLLKRD